MAPFKTLTKKEQHLAQRPWINSDILEKINERDKIHKTFLKTVEQPKRSEIFDLYKLKRNEVVSLIRKSKKSYFEDFFEENKTDIKKVWQGIKNIVNINKKQDILPSKLKFKNNFYSKDSDIAECFNSFFTNIGNSVEEKIPKTDVSFSTFLKNKPDNSLFLEPVSENEVIDMIKNLNSSKASGPSSIPTNILKIFSDSLAKPLAHIINHSFSEGVFPSALKLASICPIFKKKEKDKCENYRPISLLSNISKLFERAMHSRVYDFFEKYKLLYKNQFGFRKKHSTNHAILNIVEDIRKSLNINAFVCGVFIDLEKAFDTVNHAILLKKLEFYGIRGVSNQWLTSYLTDRKQCVKFKNSSSKFQDVTCGVPQGSILGPLLFLIYINDMHQAINNSSTYHFADDTYLKFSSKCEKELRTKMNADLKSLFTWLCANRLSLNVAKTEFIIFKPPRKSLSTRLTLKLNGTVLYESKKIKYLGLIVDDRLTWSFHISELGKSLGRAIGIIYRLKKTGCPPKVLLNLYFALFQSHLSYGLLAWGTASRTSIEKLFLLQKKIVRIISGESYTAHTGPIFKKLEILNLWDLYDHSFAKFMFDFHHYNLPDVFSDYFVRTNEIHNYNTRAHSKGSLHASLKPKNIHGSLLTSNLGVTIYNKIIDLDFFSTCPNNKLFSKKYKKYLISQY